MTTHVTKSWMEDGELVVQVIPQEQIYKREWVGLTDEEIDGLVKNTRWHELIKATEAKLKAKNFA